MRIALVSPYALAVPGGVQAQVSGLGRQLARTDDVVILAPGSDEVRDGVTVSGVGSVRAVPANGSMAPLALGFATVPRTRRALSAFAPDVVHVHEPFAPLVGIAASWHAPAPVVATFHRAGVSAAYRHAGRVLRPVIAAVGAAAAVSVEAEATLRAVVPRLPFEIEILANAVDLERFAPADKPVRDRKEVVFVGRLEPRKGPRILLEACAGLASEVHLTVVGAGAQLAELQAMDPDGRVRFAGAVSEEDKASLLAAADLFVAPSTGGESFGVVLLEAMAAGTAVIASDLAGYRLAGGGAVRYVRPGDPGALAAEIRRLAHDDGARRDLAVAGRNRALDFGFANLAARYRDLYARVLDRADTAPH